MSASKVMVLGSVLFALAMVASAVVFRGQTLGDWIESTLFIGFLAFNARTATCALTDRRRRRAA